MPLAVALLAWTLGDSTALASDLPPVAPEEKNARVLSVQLAVPCRLRT